MNYTWDDIKLNNFIKASEGDLSYVSKNNEINKDTLDAWFSIQDQYIRVLDLETIQMKRYKKVCYNYAKSLQQWIIEPTNGSKLFNKVNQLYIEKTKLAESMFNDEKKDWDVLIAQVTLSTKQRVNGDWLAKEFFNLIKSIVMATQPIDKNDIIKDGAIESIIKGFDDLTKKLNETDLELRNIAKSMGNISPAGDSKGFNDLIQKSDVLEKTFKQQVKTQNELSTLQKEKLKLDQQVEKAVAAKILVRSKENKAIQELRLEKNKENKAIRDGIKAKEREKNAYLKLQDATRDYKNQSKQLGAELLQLRDSGKKNTKEYNELAKSYARVTKQAQLGDAQLKKLDKTVGDNFRSVGAYENATRKLSSALGALGIAFGLSTVIRNVTGVVSNFNQAQADLQSISGKSAEELTGLTQQAKDLGATTQFTASQITELQIELAKLGFTAQEITDSTGGIANFAAATGVEIPRAAALAGSALRAFNLDATEIDRVVSTLGVATTKTALDFAQLETGLSTVAPVAASFGFSIEDTTALLGQLANAGFDASSSATATRNILLNLADANGALAKELGRPIKSADDLAAGLQELQAKGIDLASALELTDKRSVAAFSTFITGSKDLVSLRDSITDVNEELTVMAEKRLDSVQGAMLLLESAWEGFILDLNESVGASQAFQTAIKFIADNLTTILPLMLRLAGYFLLYTQRAKLAQIQTFLLGGGFKNLITSIPKMISGLKGLSVSFKAVGTAIKSIPLVGWIALATEALFLIKDLIFSNNEHAESIRLAREEEQRRNDEMERGNKLRAERLSIGKDIETQVKARNNLSQAELRLLKQAIEAEKAVVEQKILALKTSQQQASQANKEKASIDLLGGSYKDFRKSSDEVAEAQDKLTDIRNDGAFELQQEIDLLAKLDSNLSKINPLIKEETKARESNEKAITKTVKAREKELMTLEEIDKLLNEGRYQEDIDKDRDDSEITDLTRVLERENKERLTLINDFERNKKITEDEANDQRIIAEIDHLQRMKKLYELYGRDVTEINLQISEAQLNLSKEAKTEIEDVQESILNSLTKQVNETSKVLKSMLEESIDRAIESENRLMDNSQKMIDSLRQAAIAGNLQAKESILAEEKAIEESQKRIEKHQRNKQRMEFISSGINAFNSSVQSGKTGLQALGEASVTMSGLAAMLASLPSFDVGADRLTSDGRGVDGKGGFLAINHPDERIMTAEQNAIIGYHHKNSDIANVMSFYNKGLLKPVHEMGAVVTYDNTEILNRIEKGLANQNNWNISVDELFGTISVLIEKSKNGDIHRSKRNYKA